MNNFAEQLKAAEIHWFFIQGVQAIERDLFLPGVCSILNGIEAGLRVTLTQMAKGPCITALSPYEALSHNLINKAKENGMPVESLAFPAEDNFLAKLATPKHDRIYVDVVRLRNNICHGNILDFIKEDLEEDFRLLTPECLRDTAHALIVISKRWIGELAEYRRNNGL